MLSGFIIFIGKEAIIVTKWFPFAYPCKGKTKYLGRKVQQFYAYWHTLFTTTQTVRKCRINIKRPIGEKIKCMLKTFGV